MLIYEPRKLRHLVLRVGEQYLKPALMRNIIKSAYISVYVLQRHMSPLHIVQCRHIYRVLVKHLYAYIGKPVHNQLYVISCFLRNLALPQEFVLVKVIHRRPVEDDRRYPQLQLLCNRPCH